ncbi:retrovirus-related pol polyprotein from transposon TNT 1-94 [Tanacetum coccineum]
MANLSRNGSNALTETETKITSDSNIIPYSQYLSETQQETVQNSNSSAQQDVLILSMFEQLNTQVMHCTNVNLEYKSANKALTTELDRYKEEVKDLKEMQNVENSFSGSNEQYAEIVRLKQTLFEQPLEKKIKQLDNIIFKRGQSAQTVHMMTKSKICYDHSTKQAIGFEKTLRTEDSSESKPKLYDGNVILKMDTIVIPDSDETLMRCEESRKVFTQIGYIWKPTGRTFTIVGNACSLTRITTTNEVPSRKPIALESESPKPVVKLVYSRKPRKNKNTESVSKTKVIQPKLSKSSSGTVKFGNDQVAKIMGYGDYQIRNITISRVYYVEGLGDNLFSMGQFCDSNLEVAFRQYTCFIRNLEGVDLLMGSRGDNLYTLSLGNMMASSPICLLSKASKTKSWLWHRKSSKKPHKPKSEDTNQEKLYLLHMDLCGPMRVASVNGKKYILVIVDDYSRFTWVKCLRSKNEKLSLLVSILENDPKYAKETVLVSSEQINGTEFVKSEHCVNIMRRFASLMKHQIAHSSTSKQCFLNRRIVTLIEAARTMLIYAKAPLFLWAEAVATACYTQNRSMIHRRHGKTPYELLHDKPPDLSYLHVFGALCYPTNDCENLGKLQPKADIGIFIGYAPTKKAFWIYNRRTRRIIETIHVDFDEL